MTLLAGVLGFLLFIAVLYILINRVMIWLKKQGGYTIRIEIDENED